jgi:signal transduction histidine kinase
MTWAEFFSNRITHIYFVYGLAFFILGGAVALEVGRAEPARFNRMMRPLAFFGLVHGSHEWMEMFILIGRETYGFQTSIWFEVVRLVILAVSFTALLVFGLQGFPVFRRVKLVELSIGLPVLLLYGAGVMGLGWWQNWQIAPWFATADALARYTLAIPGAIVTAWILMAQRNPLIQEQKNVFANDLMLGAAAFLLYGVVGQIFINSSPLFPSNIINATLFQSWFGIPIQLFRAIMACLAAVAIVRSLRSFELNRRQILAATRQRVADEVARRDAMRQEFLRRIVDAQERERSRIARELHDELGQMLTGLAIGLRGAQTSLEKPRLLRQQLQQLESMAAQALGTMRHLVNELRPALLDDMGLPAALRHHIKNFQNFTGVPTTLNMGKHYHRLPENVETILFRIIQEALTNIARHAHAKYAWIDLHCDDSTAVLKVKDDGRGFDPQPILDGSRDIGVGLMGIQERVNLVAGTLYIESGAGRGTTLTVRIPLQNGKEK